MRRVLRGYAKDKDGNLILIGTMPVPHSPRSASVVLASNPWTILGPIRPRHTAS
jgi:hypothetical protein